MKTLIVYWSLTGNTDFAARRLAEALDADLLRLETEEAITARGFSLYMKGGKKSLDGARPELCPYDFEPENYDLIILGGPVWAFTVSPPMGSFIDAEKETLSGKRLAAFYTGNGVKMQKAMERQEEMLGTKFLATCLLVNPGKEKNQEKAGREIEAFAREIREAF